MSLRSTAPSPWPGSRSRSIRSARLTILGAAIGVFAILLVAWARARCCSAPATQSIVAAVLLVGHDALLHFLFLTAILGGALALLVLADSWIEKYYAVTLRIAYPAGAAPAA